MELIPFNQPFMTGLEGQYIADAHAARHLSGDGGFTRRAEQRLAELVGAERVLLTHSCTASLEMAAMLSGFGPGDEVIVPSYTFVSTANAFAKLGATPVFVDIDPETLNLDWRQLEGATTGRTRAIVPVHYAGVPCDMREIQAYANQHGLIVIEDAAQALGSSYMGRPAGAIGHMGAYSFHETKNIISGEGGALVLSTEQDAARAEIIREKGTNRRAFFRGHVDKYTWVDLGSSYIPSDIIGAFLSAQLEHYDAINSARMHIWHSYHSALEAAEAIGQCRRPVVPSDRTHNAHMYYLLLPSTAVRDEFMTRMRHTHGVQCVFHYVPLHSSPKGQEVGRYVGSMAVTNDIHARLVRLPLWVGLEEHQERVISSVLEVLDGL